MARISLGSLLALAGLAVLMHTTWEVIKYREMLKLLQEDFEMLPLPLLVEVAVGAAMATAGAYSLSGTLRSIGATKQSRGSDIGSLRPDFMAFNTRSRAFPLNLPPLK